ncbi:MAG: preprotein translocase subunit SecG [Gemmatimonadota bacterium]
MFVFLVVLMVLLAIGLCVMILLQAGKGGGLASTFGGASSSTESFMGGHQAATALVKGTWIGGALFLLLGLTLSVLSVGEREGEGESILQDQFREEGVPAGQQQPSSVLESEPPPAEEDGGEGGGGSPLPQDGGSP